MADTGLVSGPRVLLVEDDLTLRRLLALGLDEEGFTVATATTGSETFARVNSCSPDVLVIDIGLPDADGRDLCQALRARGVRAPVLFLTAQHALTDRLAGFGAGGDDYLTKPFALAEVAARLRALVRRAGGERRVEVAGLLLDPAEHAITAGERRMALTPTEFRLIAALAGSPGETLTRRQLIRAAWPDGAIVHDNTLDVYLARLRRKLRELPDSPRVVTVHGVGYRLE